MTWERKLKFSESVLFVSRGGKSIIVYRVLHLFVFFSLGGGRDVYTKKAKTWAAFVSELLTCSFLLVLIEDENIDSCSGHGYDG